MRINTFVAQREALFHAKPMLLIHHRQAQTREADLLLKQGMRAHCHLGRAGGDLFQHGKTRALGHAAGDPRQRNAERAQPLVQLAVMLFSQNLGRRHDRRLIAMFQCLGAGQCGNDGFAATDIPLQQALHGMAGSQIAADFIKNTLLRAS